MRGRGREGGGVCAAGEGVSGASPAVAAAVAAVGAPRPAGRCTDVKATPIGSAGLLQRVEAPCRALAGCPPIALLTRDAQRQRKQQQGGPHGVLQQQRRTGSEKSEGSGRGKAEMARSCFADRAAPGCTAGGCVTTGDRRALRAFPVPRPPPRPPPPPPPPLRLVCPAAAVAVAPCGNARRHPVVGGRQAPRRKGAQGDVCSPGLPLRTPRAHLRCLLRPVQGSLCAHTMPQETLKAKQPVRAGSPALFCGAKR